MGNKSHQSSCYQNLLTSIMFYSPQESVTLYYHNKSRYALTTVMDKLMNEKLNISRSIKTVVRESSHNQEKSVEKSIPMERKVGRCDHNTSGNLNPPKMKAHRQRTRKIKLTIGELVI